ncbi:MAG TPA: hypothetical protein VK617_08500 [Gemmatimonadaceae bacterium]|nr:hypothetical protein [Gemmatimonadaceae bacterium]
MASPETPIFLQLTEEQQAIVHRMSGQHLQVLELTPDAGDASSGTGRGIQFRWRQSLATGIPRQNWEFRDDVHPPAPDESAPKK